MLNLIKSAFSLSLVTIHSVLPVSTQAATLEVLERGQNYRLVQTTRRFTNHVGEATVQTNRYTEIVPGLHRYENGEWVESEETIEVTPDGYAVANRGAYTVIFSPNLNTVGTIDLVTPAPNQKRLRSHVLGVYLTDSAAGKSMQVATVRDSIAMLFPPNTIVYPSAFEGLDADMRFSYRKGVFEADLVLKENLVLPGGFSPNSTRLELVTEFIDSPSPDVTQCVLGSADGVNLVDDALLNFGGMMMIPGKAFSIDETAGGLDDQ